MHNTRIACDAYREPAPLEQFKHWRVLGQNFSNEAPKSHFARDRNQMAQKKVANALSLISIGDHERYFRSVVADLNVATAADDYRAPVFIHHGDKSDMLLEVYFDEVFRLLLGKDCPHRKKAAVERLRTCPVDGRLKGPPVRWLQSTDLYTASILQGIDHRIVLEVRHCLRPLGQTNISLGTIPKPTALVHFCNASRFNRAVLAPTAVTSANAVVTENGAAIAFPAFQMISLIDDDESIRSANASLLRSLGYQVATFDSALTFLNSEVHITQSECVITDIMMPGIDGVELYWRLVIAGHRIPLIFLTALTDAATIARIRCCKVQGILIKPCTETVLINYVNAAFELKRRTPD